MIKELVRALAFGVGVAVCLCVILVGLLLFVFPPSPPPPPEEAASPAWSPDGQHIAFECYIDGPTEPVRDSSQRQYSHDAADICVINVNGSHRIRLTANDVADTYPTWSPDGTHIAYISRDGIYVIGSDGSNQRRLVHIPAKAFSYGPKGLTWSPDGKYLAFSACLEQDRDIYVVGADDGVLTNLTAGNLARDMNPQWLPNSKQIVFLSSPFLTDDSCLPFEADARSRLKSIDLDGTGERDIYGEALYYFVSVSPTGQIAFIANMRARNYIEEGDFAEDTLLYTIQPGQEEPTSWDQARRACIWSPDGRYLACGYYILDVKTGEKRQLQLTSYPVISISWSPDGRKLAITSHQEIGNIFAERIVILDMQTGIVRPLVPREESR